MFVSLNQLGVVVGMLAAQVAYYGLDLRDPSTGWRYTLG